MLCEQILINSQLSRLISLAGLEAQTDVVQNLGMNVCIEILEKEEGQIEALSKFIGGENLNFNVVFITVRKLGECKGFIHKVKYVKGKRTASVQWILCVMVFSHYGIPETTCQLIENGLTCLKKKKKHSLQNCDVRSSQNQPLLIIYFSHFISLLKVSPWSNKACHLFMIQ